MKKLFLLMKISLIGLVLAIQPAKATEEAGAGLSKALNNYTTYQANFQQSSHDKKGAQQSHGKVYMMRPGRFRWETTQPYAQTVIANGNTVWIYDADLKQASKQSLAKRGFNPGELLTQPVTELTQKFTVTEEANGWYKLIPKQGGQGFKVAYLQFRDNKLTGLKIINQLNQTNVFTFSQIQLNPHLSPGLFEFKAPHGVQVMTGK